MRTRLIAGLAVVALLALTGCARPVPAAGSSGAIQVQDPYARTAIQGGTGGAFMVISNGGPEDRLVGAAFAGSQTVELHETVEENGAMKMVHHPEGWVVPAGGKLELKPGGKHLMLIDLKEALIEGRDIELVLKFEKAGEMKVKAAVRKP